MSDQRVRLGVDLGGTKTEIIALGPEGDELGRRRVPSAPSYPGTLDTVTGLVEEMERDLGAEGSVGLGIPGVVSPVTGLVKNANSLWLIGQRLDADLEERLGRPIRIMNDANCFALSEAIDGAGAGVASVFGVILGTGVGGGFALDGKPVQGAQMIAGEWGHNPLPWPTDDERPGPECYCGQHGCIETFLSGPGMERDHLSATGNSRTTREIATDCVAGDTDALATMVRYVDRLARGLATVVNVLDPEVIVFGGGLSNLPGLVEATRHALPSRVFTDHARTRLALNRHGDSSGVRGAAWLWG